MELSKFLTIVIPCKNESKTIDSTLSLLNFQDNINNVNVIVSDSSTDETTYQLEIRNRDKFNLKIIEGGLPAKARNNGSIYVKTPYVLFMDSDMFLLDPTLLTTVTRMMLQEEIDLLTTKIRTTNGKYNYVFRTFDFIQKISKIISPFCLGGFMLFKTNTFNELGGFNEESKVAEDYLLSKQINPRRFKIINTTVFTPPRRFDNKGVIYMMRLMIKSFLNRNNKQFFSDDNTYWK
jgi:cellulose synthase/poly-beta-1,6-N-acetylglucosamine synthase-like glycosyltransferase